MSETEPEKERKIDLGTSSFTYNIILYKNIYFYANLYIKYSLKVIQQK